MGRHICLKFDNCISLFVGNSKLHESNHGNPSHHHVFFDVRGNAKEVLTCFSWQVITRKGHTLILSNTNCKTNILTLYTDKESGSTGMAGNWTVNWGQITNSMPS